MNDIVRAASAECGPRTSFLSTRRPKTTARGTVATPNRSAQKTIADTSLNDSFT